MDRGRRRWGVVGLSTTAAVGVAAVVLFVATNDDGSMTGPSPTATSVGSSSAPSAVERWEEQVSSFGGGASSSGCTLLETGDGEVMLSVGLKGTVGETITRGPAPLGPDDYAVSVLLGSGLTADSTCTTDMPDGSPPAPRQVVTNWPASAAEATITVTRDDVSCAVAVVHLDDVVVTSSSGRQIEIGDVGITNDAWFYWAPFECRLPGG